MKLSAAVENCARLWLKSDGRAWFFIALGKMPCCLQLSRPHIFWQIGCEAFTTDAHIAKIISAKLPLWPARGTWQAPPCIALSNRIFPGQCKLWQIPSSCIMRFPANLPNSRESGRVSLFQLRGMLSDWMMLKLQPSTPVLSPLPSCDHLVSSVFSYFFPHFFEATSVGLGGNWSTNLTWAQKNYVNAKAPWHKHWSVTVSSGEVKCVCVCVWLCLCGCNMKDRTQQFEMSLLHVTVWTSKKKTKKKQRHEAAGPEIQVLCVQKHPA